MNNTTLSKQDIAQIADLIKIFIPDSELDNYADQLDTALGYTEVFDELDIEDEPTLTSTTGIINILREDEPEASLSQDDATSNSHLSENGYMVVQRVVHK